MSAFFDLEDQKKMDYLFENVKTYIKSLKFKSYLAIDTFYTTQCTMFPFYFNHLASGVA